MSSCLDGRRFRSVYDRVSNSSGFLLLLEQQYATQEADLATCKSDSEYLLPLSPLFLLLLWILPHVSLA